VRRAVECQTCGSYVASAPDPPAVAPAGTAEPGECRFRGRGLAGPEREARGLGHARQWSFCENPARPLGDAVCPCRGCGPGCSGYSAAPAQE
jgi:hypothetical protein